MTKPAQALFALVAVAALAALLVNQRLKDQPAYLRRVQVTGSFTPDGDHRGDTAAIRFVLGRADDVSAAIIDARGAIVRHLGTRRRRRARARIAFRWDGRTSAGTLAPAGTYRVRVRLGRAGRTIVLRDAIRLRTRPPRSAPAGGAGTAPGSRAPGATRPPPRRRSQRTATALEEIALVLVALLAAGTLVLTRARVRAVAMTAALVAAPGLLAAHLWQGSQLTSLRDRPLVLLAGGALVVAALVAASRPLVRRPEALAVAAVAVMPFRIPVPVAGSTVSLLVPLYAVIAAGVLAELQRRRGRDGDDGDDGEAGRPSRVALVDRLLAATLVLFAVQAAYSSDFTQALQQVAFFYVPFAALFALLTRIAWTPALLATCLRVLAALALLLCALAVVQYATGWLLLNEGLRRSNAYSAYFRVNGLFYDPNVLGRFLAVVAIGIAAVAAWATRPRTVAVAGGVLAVLLVGLLTTRSQSSLLALLVGLGVLAALRSSPRVVLAGAAAMAIVGALVVVIHPGVVDLSSGDAADVRRATSGRSDLVTGAADLFARRPLAGWGSGSFIAEYRRQVLGGRFDQVAASHTIPLTVAVEQGLVGLALYLTLLAVAMRVLLHRARESLPRAALAAAFAALFVHTLLYASYLEDPLAWVILAVGTALAAQTSSTATTSVSPTLRKSV